MVLIIGTLNPVSTFVDNTVNKLLDFRSTSIDSKKIIGSSLYSTTHLNHDLWQILDYVSCISNVRILIVSHKDVKIQ